MLNYRESDRSDSWPFILKTVSNHINNTGHHTIQTPSLPEDFCILSCISDKEKLALAEKFSISVRLKAYNATEKMILKNQRARMKKIIIPKINKGDEVMFRNPFHVSSLSITLNACGTVKKTLSRNVYEVEFDGRKIMLFGSELVLDQTKLNLGID